MPDITGVRNHRMKVPSLILRRRPALSRGAGAPRLAAQASQALPAPHCFAVGLASQASEPFGFLGSSGSPAVCLRGSGSRHAPPAASRWSPFAGCGAACGVSLRPSEPFGLLGHSFCHSREGGNPGAPYCFRLSSMRRLEPGIIRPKEVYRSYRIAKSVTPRKVSRKRTTGSFVFESSIRVEISQSRPSGAPSKRHPPSIFAIGEH